jgi:hypothetical protein
VTLKGERILVKCFAECSVTDIVRAMGLEMKDLFLKGDEEKAESHPKKKKFHTTTDEKMENSFIRMFAFNILMGKRYSSHGDSTKKEER